MTQARHEGMQKKMRHSPCSQGASVKPITEYFMKENLVWHRLGRPYLEPANHYLKSVLHGLCLYLLSEGANSQSSFAPCMGLPQTLGSWQSLWSKPPNSSGNWENPLLSWTMATVGEARVREVRECCPFPYVSINRVYEVTPIRPSWRSYRAKWGFLRHLKKGEWNPSSDSFSPEARDKWTDHFPRISWTTDGPWSRPQRMVAVLGL